MRLKNSNGKEKKFRNSNGDKSQKLKLLQNPKTPIVKKLKISKCDKTKNSNIKKKNTKTPIVTKLQL